MGVLMKFRSGIGLSKRGIKKLIEELDRYGLISPSPTLTPSLK